MLSRLPSLALLFAAAALFATMAPASAQTNEYRGFWVDAWGTGFRTATEVNTLTNDLRRGNFNMVIPQVRRRGDAFYNSNFEPKNPSVSPASFDPLADLIAKCNNTNFGPKIEVHAWIVTYHIWQGTNLPTATNHPYNLHPDWLLEDFNGNKLIDNEWTFDPGHPDVQRHTFNVAMDIIANYNVDGFNFDYVRYSSSSVGYNPVSVARFNQLYGRTGKPATTDAAWKQFRRDQVTALVRKVYLNAIALKPQVKISADTITWSPGPTSLASWYSSSAAWNNVLQDWRGWMEEGILDLNIPMAYFDQAGAYTTAWTNWCNFTRDHQYNRHALIGPGIYLNSVSNAIVQMRHTRNPSPGGNFTRGHVGYSYRVTNKDGVSRSTFINALLGPSVYDPITPAIYAQPATIPVMPWKATPTLGHLKGTIYSGNITNALDGAVVTLAGPVSRVQTNDATGFYGFVDLPPGNYTVAATFPGYAPASNSVTVAVGSVATRDLNLSLIGPPEIVTQPASRTNFLGTLASFSVSVSGAAPFAYQWRKDGTNIVNATNSLFTIPVVAAGDAGDYRVVVTNSFGSVTSAVATLTVVVPDESGRLQSLWSLAPGSRPYLTSNDTQRGLAWNPATGNLILVSRSPGTNIMVLNSTNGAEIRQLSNGPGVISGGTFPVNLVGVADDGAIYVGNLTTSAGTSDFRLYRWASDGAGVNPTLAYAGNPVPSSNERWGDTLDVRGGGTNTQILLSSRSGTNVALLTTTNGTNFTATPIAVSGGVGGMSGLGLAFGAGNTFWGKANSQALRQVAFNPGAGTGSVIQSFTNPVVANGITAIGVNTNLGLLAGVNIASPNTLMLYDLPLSGAPAFIGQTNFPTDNLNGNATGAVDFGGDRVFALNSNNGLLALQILPPPTPPVIVSNPQPVTVLAGENALFSVTATGTPPLAYHWRFNGAPLGGPNGDTLSLLNVLPTEAGDYSVIVSNVAGAVTSAVATLTVLVAPEIIADPQDLTVTNGSSATFTVTATGTAPLRYQWFFNGTPLAAATNAAYTRAAAQPGDAGFYSVVVSNVVGAVASGEAELVVQFPPVITTHPAGRTVRVGSNVTFTVAASAVPAPEFQWWFNGVPIGGATTASYTRLNAQTNDAGNYSVTVSNALGGIVSSNALLVVNPWTRPQFQSITRLPDGRMHLVITGEPDADLWVDAAPALTNWSLVTNLFNTSGTVEFTDGAATNEARRFYRARQ